MIVLLCGSNRLAIAERVQQLRAEHDPSGINTTAIESAADHIGDLRGAALASGFFGATRLVIAYDLLGGKTSGRGKRSGAPASHDEAISLLREVPPSTLLVLIEASLNAAEMKDIRVAVEGIRIESLDVPRGRDLVNWVQRRAQDQGTAIDAVVGTRLLEALFPGTWQAAARRDDQPPDLQRLSTEIAKLATAAGSGGAISAEIVASLVPGAESLNVWGLSNAIAAGNAAEAIHELEQALAHGTAAEALIGQLAAQFETLAALAAAGPTSLTAVAAETGLSEARLRQAGRGSRSLSMDRIQHGLGALHEIDLAAKRGEVDAQDLLVGVIVELAAAR